MNNEGLGVGPKRLLLNSLFSANLSNREAFIPFLSTTFLVSYIFFNSCSWISK